METFDLHCVWRAANGARLVATFAAAVLERDEKRMGRLLVRVTALQSSGWENGPADEALSAQLLKVVGKRCYVPPEATEGLVLPLKEATLTFQMRYFFD